MPRWIFGISVLLLILIGKCYADEGFLLIKHDAVLHKDKECNIAKFEKPLYKFTLGIIEKKYAGKIYVLVKGYLLALTPIGTSVDMPIQKHELIGFRGWIDENDVISFQYSKTSGLYDEATRIFLKKYFP